MEQLKRRLNQAGGVWNEDLEDWELFRKGNLEGFADLLKKMYSLKNQELYRILFHDRNLIQSDHLDQFLKQNPTEIAFGEYGLGHLVDTPLSIGVLTLLKQKKDLQIIT